VIEIRIHGRGGQGNVVAANLLAMAAFEEGQFGQAFPNFGAERRGAPVMAFVRVHDGPIRRRNQVLTPAFLIIQDEALLHVPGITAGLLPGGGVLVNSSRPAETLTDTEGLDVVTLPAFALALEHLGRPVPNTALLAAFLSLTGMFSVDSLVRTLSKKFRGEVLERNVELVRVAAERVPLDLWKDRLH
jgi:pyruvate ferredoxin oxidoreductase gamma subunit